MRFEIVDKDDNVLATFDPSAGRATDWTGSVPETTMCRFRMYRLPSEKADIKLTLAGNSLQAIAERQDADTSRQVKFEWERYAEDVFRMPCWRYFEDMAGPIRIGIRSRRFGTRNYESVADSAVCVEPVKFGNSPNRARAVSKLEGSPFPSLFKVGCQPPPNSQIYEKWAFECTRSALGTVAGIELTPVVREWANAVEGCPWTTGPVLLGDLGSGQRLRVRHEPMVRKIGEDNRLDELYTLRGDSLRPDITIELLEKEHGSWALKTGVVCDCKYADASGLTRRHKLRQIDHSYGHCVTARHRAISQLWLISSGGDSAGITIGPADGTICMMHFENDYAYAEQGFKRHHLVVQPTEDYAKHFEAFASAALTALMEGGAA